MNVAKFLINEGSNFKRAILIEFIFTFNQTHGSKFESLLIIILKHPVAPINAETSVYITGKAEKKCQFRSFPFLSHTASKACLETEFPDICRKCHELNNVLTVL